MYYQQFYEEQEVQMSQNKEAAATAEELWVKVVKKGDIERYENIKKEEEIERYENIIQELKKREMEGPRVFYQALHEIYDLQRGGDKSKVIQLMSSYHKS